MIIYLAFNQVAPYYSFVVAPRNQPTPSRRRQQDTHFWCYFGANPVQPDLPDLTRDQDQDRSPSLKIYAATLRNPPWATWYFPITPNFAPVCDIDNSQIPVQYSRRINPCWWNPTSTNKLLRRYYKPKRRRPNLEFYCICLNPSPDQENFRQAFISEENPYKN